MPHPLLGLLLDAARGRPPAPDGSVEVLPGPPGPVDAVLAFTAHHLVVGDVDPDQVAAGNAASLRALAAAGFRPLGAEVLFDRGA